MSTVLGGRYEVIRELGAGAMGVVWLAHDTVLDRSVALKELRAPEGVQQDEALERFVTEAQAVARLSHPSIVTVHDVFAEGDRVLMSLELLDGPTLAEVIAAGPLGSAARPIMAGVAEALAAAHAHGVVHRDLKPENIFVLPSGRVVVCDFGLARIGAGRGTHIGTVMGTPGYMAPEQIRGLDVGPAADVFAWGAVTYELASGMPPFGDPATQDLMALAWRVTNEEPAGLVCDDDHGLASVVSMALAKEPAARFPNGEALAQALEASRRGEPIAVGAASGPPPAGSSEDVRYGASTPPTAPPNRNRAALGGMIAAAVVALSLAGVLGAVLLSETSTPEAQLTEVLTRDRPERGADSSSVSGSREPTTRSSSSPSPSPRPTATAASTPTPTPVAAGPGGPGSPEWESFVVQVASKPKSSSTRAAAQDEATTAFGFASDELSVLDSDAYDPAMKPGYWVIYAGPYTSRAQAADALDRLAGALPGDAHVRHLDPDCPSAPCS